MRLIDADVFATEEPKLWDWSSVDGVSSTAVLKQCIWDVQCAPTVEAVPVDWLLNHIPHDEVMYEYNRKLIEYLVIGWRNENESNTCD